MSCHLFLALVCVTDLWACPCSGVVQEEDADITALAVKGGSLWLGTRNGYLLTLDSYVMEEGKDPLLGLQHCGQGRVKCIIPLTPLPNASSKLQVPPPPPHPSCHLRDLIFCCLPLTRSCAVWSSLTKYRVSCWRGSISTREAIETLPPSIPPPRSVPPCLTWPCPPPHLPHPLSQHLRSTANHSNGLTDPHSQHPLSSGPLKCLQIVAQSSDSNFCNLCDHEHFFIFSVMFVVVVRCCSEQEKC